MLDRLVSILPPTQQAKAKAWVAWLGTVAALLTLVIPDAPPWLTGAILVLSALGVYKAPNVGYVRPTRGQGLAPFVGQTPAGKRTPGGLAIWGGILAVAGIVEVWGITNPGSHDTLSEFTRWIFDTDDSGALVFGVGWVGFAAWFLWHILGGRKKRAAPQPLMGDDRFDVFDDGNGDEDYRA